MDDPWGLDDPPAEHAGLPLPPRLATLAALTGQQAISEDDPLWAWPAAPELPEVQALMADGWYPLDAAPLHGLLPTIWPREHRCWVPDRLPRIAHRTDGVTSYLAPSRRHRHAAPDELVSEQAIEAGLPTPPAGRIWLLRSPFPAVPMRVLLRLIWLRSMQVWREGRPAGLPSDMLRAGKELLSWSEETLLDWWTGAEADAWYSWQRQGRSASEVAELVVRGLGPDDIEALISDGLTEREIVGWHDVLAGTGRPLVDTVRLWRGRGVDLRQSVLLTRLVWVPEEEVVEWTAAGFEYAAMVQLAAVPLMRADRVARCGIRACRDPCRAASRRAVVTGRGSRVRWGRYRRAVHGQVGRVRFQCCPGVGMDQGRRATAGGAGVALVGARPE